MKSLLEQWRLLVPLLLGGIALWLLLPREGKRSWILGGVLGLAGLVTLQQHMLPRSGDLVYDGLFFLFAGGAVLSAAMMVTDRNPVYAALWFAVVTLSTCGLFLLNAAPFLAAVTIIVYAGAIVVTFVFVIMLAQQAGAAAYDRRAFQPTVAVIGSFLLLGGMLYTLQEWGTANAPVTAAVQGATAPPQFVVPPATIVANALSQPLDDDLGSLRGVGRSLFGDYLFAVEIAGTVLLIATIAAIALAPRRAQGTL